ncbi:hypothetical protein OG875_10025 [Streptomyces sp. NBC_01498]|uniref:hypothetical protein n=1 Tax=Streptomyces sp. NBC_01498 TaxID=2975870 RepID=UPI002E7B4D35|nr:hypothetical protein [Streptomyces sp. NBC_01498]WTL24908.1 hypothetical protein OG875_10025 [Streptomyces sp. NBC_01498]
MSDQYGGPVPGNPYAQPQPQPQQRQPGAQGAFGPPPPAYPPGPVPPYAPPHPSPYAPTYGPTHPDPRPEFLAADSRSGIVVDENGVTFDIEGRTAEFPWSVVRSVHSRPGAVGHRLLVAVVLPDGRFYECGVKARNRATLDRWFRELGHVLHIFLFSRQNGPAAF